MNMTKGIKKKEQIMGCLPSKITVPIANRPCECAVAVHCSGGTEKTMCEKYQANGTEEVLENDTKIIQWCCILRITGSATRKCGKTLRGPQGRQGTAKNPAIFEKNRNISKKS